jgi:PIN domain nuclease of toxin-antitoxin system
MSSGVVIDASAALAYVFEERGGGRVPDALDGAAISAVNWAEVVEKAISADVDDRSLRTAFEGLGAIVLPVDAEHSEYAARLRKKTKGLGLSLADRFCFALAASRNAPVMTADRAWAKVDVGVEVLLIR